MDFQGQARRILTDQKISQEINKSHLTTKIDEKYKCISNSIIVRSDQGNKLVYFAKIANQKKYCLVAINNITNSNEIVQTYQLSSQKQFILPDEPYLQIKANNYDTNFFAFAVIDLKASNKKRIINIALMNIQFQQLKRTRTLKIYQIYLSKTINQIFIKDFQWHPYTNFGLLVLLNQKIQFFRIDLSVTQPIYEITFKDLLDQNNRPITIPPSFSKFCIPNKLIQQNKYLSIGEKVTIYLISNTGIIFCITSFFCNGLCLNEDQKNYLQKILEKPKNHNQKQLLKQLKNGEIIQLQIDQEFHSQRYKKYCLIFRQLQSATNHFLYKINDQYENRKIQKAPTNPIQDFYVFNLQRRTIFVSCLKNKNNQGVLKMQILLQNPFQETMKCQQKQMKINLTTQIAGEIICDQILPNHSMKIVQPIDMNYLYLLINNSICYKINFQGLQKLIKNPIVQESPENKLLDIDILFQLKSQILCLAKNHKTIYLLRNQMKNYYFNTIPLQSIPLKQKIRQTNQETQKLFQKLVLENQKNKNKISEAKNQKMNFQELNQQTLISLQEKLNKFSYQYKKTVERKLQKIKILYDGIKIKNNKINAYNKDKQHIIDLVEIAEKNDQKIKQIMHKSSKQASPSQKQFSRRIKASQTFLNELKQSMQSQYQNLLQDQQKRQTIYECQEQADGILDCLLNLKKQLLEKKRLLEVVKNS